MTHGKIWYRNMVGFLAKRPTSGFEVPTGSRKIAHAIARVELYTPPKFHANRSNRLGGDRFAHIKKTASKFLHCFLDINYVRMDGRDKQDKRDQNVKKFQRDESIRCFMLTTGVGAGK